MDGKRAGRAGLIVVVAAMACVLRSSAAEGRTATVATNADTTTATTEVPAARGMIRGTHPAEGTPSRTRNSVGQLTSTPARDLPARMPDCNESFRPTSTTLFNDPSGSAKAQERILRYLVKLIDCTPPTNPDGSQASIHTSFYSMTYEPMRTALAGAADRGVSVQVIANSHADRFASWEDLAGALGSDTSADHFAVTCWQGCLGPRVPPMPGGPTAWFTARAKSADSWTTVFTDRSMAGGAPITSWTWDFGDGTGAIGPGPHTKTYRAEGLYAASLTVHDTAGQSHRLAGTVTVPDSLEPMIPSLHSKLFLFSTVGIGKRAARWVSAYGSGNPTYQQARKGFNNLNVSVGGLTLYRAFDTYFADLVAASRGRLLTSDYYRSVAIPADAAMKTPRTVIHFLPRATGDVQLEVLRSIQCRYLLDGQSQRTKVRISMFAFTRVELAAELWRMAYERGCVIDLVYAQMTQRLRGAYGAWLPGEAGAAMPWGPADCLATPPTGDIDAAPAAPRSSTVASSGFREPAGPCASGELDGRVAGAQPGVLVDRTSPTGGGRLTVTASCPVEPYYDRMLQVWAFRCVGSSMHTHQKMMLVDGMVEGTVEKYVLTGSANWSVSGLQNNDEVVVELNDVPAIHDAYLAAFQHQKRVFIAKAARGAAERVEDR